MILEVINTHDQLVAAGGGVALTYLARGDAREMRVPGWSVYRVVKGRAVNTDNKAHWMNYGKKFFGTGCGNGRRERLAEAQAWVAAQGWYSGEWKRNRMGDYVPAQINADYPLRKL